MNKGRIIGILIILVFGAAKMPFEQKLTEEHRAAFFHGVKFDLSVRQQLSQAEYLAALGGFRAVVADFLWIEGHVAWEKTEWGRMILLFDNAVTLQPRNVNFWDIFGWHVGYNASVAAFDDPHEPDPAKRLALQHQYFKAAEDVYLRGIKNNPDSYFLYEKLAELYQYKFKDHLKAYEYYTKAAAFPDAPTYDKRMAAYELSYEPGREQEAYDLLAQYYRMGEQEHLPTLLNRLKYLEDKLNIPPSQRIYNPGEKQ
ncbi:MAG TPA: hypothetical protein VG733_11805 [Chthoniobacteraceae bacterium]|nr:hypothetical protein [Chthoniobacteraceae bacterium]